MRTCHKDEQASTSSAQTGFILHHAGSIVTYPSRPNGNFVAWKVVPTVADLVAVRLALPVLPAVVNKRLLLIPQRLTVSALT
ncbi:MAG: hypothetical protein Q7J20_12380 [Candidatus Nitrotoga sp.]|nr:hypothetical protein [Candidatus Nitrotoga sp.]MDO9448664.1 hypothetical protein [Candidatus Nitrotoga sp.]MDP3496343.1 hypothetical protein [Candidatus Nitrotoga sp.]